ncbi:hypothetical protein HYW82_01805 [Candidatus Peregrinibacteria bacterium]|nr:hypothetical protein [Candidatus Peregrinibacteria bacterium]
MKIFHLLKKSSKVAKMGRFAEFFLHASEKKKKDVFKKAAHKANKEQRELLTSARLKTS